MHNQVSQQDLRSGACICAIRYASTNTSAYTSAVAARRYILLRSSMKYFVLSILATLSSNALSAWDGSERGEIGLIEATAESNFAYRIHLKDAPQLCGNANTFAYINKADSNYETYVSLLTAAKFAKTQVTIYTNRDSNGYCKIGHVFIH